MSDTNNENIDSNETMKVSTQYDASQIQVLEGLEPVRKRPGMYIGSTGPRGLHHLVYEVVDNSIDEAMAGHCSDILVTINPDNSVRIEDNGRGIPVDIHPEKKKSALELVLTVLHAGGKFGGDSGYKVSGGLHGVGVSVVNALSEILTATVYRNGKIYQQVYKKGKPQGDVTPIGETDKRGTVIEFKPDATIFETTDFEYDVIAHRLKELAYLNKGVKIIYTDMRIPEGHTEPKPPEEYYFTGGLKEYVAYLNENKNVLTPILHFTDTYTYVEKLDNRETKKDVLVELAFQYNDGVNILELSFANNINTRDGGTHVTGFKAALTRIINDYGKKNNLLKDVSLSGDDVREGLTTIISVKLPEPQFEGQTKEKLGTTQARSAVEQAMGDKFADFMLSNPKIAATIIAKALLARKAAEAAKKARDMIRKGPLEGFSSLPGKLADCSEKDPTKCEMYLVEGDSAGGSAKQGRNRAFQAILPLRGKILNVEKAQKDKIFGNEEIRTMITAIGTGIDEVFNIEKLRYHKVIIMTDADVDGAHIRTLLLTFFYRYALPLVEQGYVYIAQPPLYKVSRGNKLVKYCYNDHELEELWKTEKKDACTIQRYKGLGEMNPEQLWETTMNPESRTILKVEVEDAVAADKLFNILMGDNVEPRRIFLEEHSHEVKNLDI